jgi:DNA-binding response OmpR family regulator
MTKPFSPRELVARVSSVLRRARYDPERSTRFDVTDLSIDSARMRVERKGVAIDLTATEFQLLAALARHPGRVFTRAQLLDEVRGAEVDSFERAIDAHVKNIRRKLERDAHRPRYVLTVYGIGYKFAEA